MQKRSLYAAFLAAVVGITGVIVALVRRRPAPISDIAVQTSITPAADVRAAQTPVMSPTVVRATTIPVEQTVVRESAQPSIAILLTSGLGVGSLITAQTLLLNSRNPILPLLLFAAGILLLQPMLSQVPQVSQAQYLNRTILGGQTRIAPIILGLAVIALLLNIIAPPPFGEQFQILNVLIAVLVVPAVYVMGDAYAGSQVGLIAAGFAAVSGWTLALGKAEPEYISLAIIGAVTLVALEYVRRRQGNIIYVIWLGFFLGAIIILTRLMATSALVDPSVSEQIPTNPQLSPVEGLFTSLLMFNLTSDPNPLHGIVDRPVFSPVLSALFIVGLLTLAWRIDSHRRWVDVFLLLALVITLLPTSFQMDLPVRYPDLQRGAMALPIALVIAAIGASSLAQALTVRLGRNGVVIAIVLFAAALLVIVLDANQHYNHVFLPIYERSVISPG